MWHFCVSTLCAVAVPPTVYNLKNVTGVEGHEATLVCLSYGDPAPTMAFQKTSKSEPYRMGENVSICSQHFRLCTDKNLSPNYELLVAVCWSLLSVCSIIMPEVLQENRSCPMIVW